MLTVTVQMLQINRQALDFTETCAEANVRTGWQTDLSLFSA